MGISFAAEAEDEVNSSINTTPLVDVMLVLLIIFLITIPVVTKTVPLQLPRETNQPREMKPQNINLSVDSHGKMFWNESEVSSIEALVQKLKGVASLARQPEVQIRGDANVPFEAIGRVILACQRAGIQHLGFITEPPPRG